MAVDSNWGWIASDNSDAWLESLDWIQPEKTAKEIEAVLTRWAGEAGRERRPECAARFHAALDWLTARQAPHTGLWGTGIANSRAFETTARLIRLYARVHRPVRALARLVDDALARFEVEARAPGSHRHGFFDLLEALSSVSAYRATELAAALATVNRTPDTKLQDLDPIWFREPQGGAARFREGARVGVVVTCFNLGQYLFEALDSIARQTLEEFDVLIVDDGSTDPFTTAYLDFLEARGYRTLRGENVGLARARNKGISRLASEYLCCFDADDAMRPEWLECASTRLDSEPDVAFVSCYYATFDNEDAVYRNDFPQLPEMLVENQTVGVSLFRRSAWTETGGYSPRFQGMEDWDFWLGILGQGHHGAVLPEILFDYRSRGGSMYSQVRQPDVYAANMRLLLERHRRAFEAHWPEALLLQARRFAELLEVRHAERRDAEIRLARLQALIDEQSDSPPKPLRILLDMSLHYRNMGDLAMIQVCVRRLRAIWPDARIAMFTSDPAGLAARFPGAEPILADARRAWFDPQSPPSSLAERMRSAFFDAIRDANLLVLAGMGGLNDAFEAGALEILHTARLARSLGVPVVAFSQGIGPIRQGSRLWDEARRTLPLLDLIAVRENRTGPALLRELGVKSHNVVVTGDDAVELAYRTGSLPQSVIGVSLRAAAYSAMNQAAAQALGTALKAIALELGAELAPIAISHVPGESDLRTYAAMFGDAGEPESEQPLDPEEWIRRVGRCRVVVAGSYHAAVFALSQGIPAVCIAASPYYRDKFLGLAEQFGTGCEVLQLEHGVEDIPLPSAVRRLWEQAPAVRAPLLAAAQRQIDAARGAYACIRSIARTEPRGSLSMRERMLDLSSEWHAERIRTLESELASTVDYLHKVEEARDWHHNQADGARTQLDEAARYIRQLEKAANTIAPARLSE